MHHSTANLSRRCWAALLLVGGALPLAIAGCSAKPTNAPGAATSATTPAAGDTATSGGSSGPKRLIFITNGDDPFWDACNAGLIEGGKQFDIGSQWLRVVMENNNGTAQGQI